MPTISTDQALKFIKEFTLPLVILGVGVWYLSTKITEYEAKSDATTLYIRGEMSDQTDKTTEALALSTQVVASNTQVLKDKQAEQEIIRDSVVRQEITLGSIDESMRASVETGVAVERALTSFSTDVREDHLRQEDKLDSFPEQIEEILNKNQTADQPE